MSSTYRRQIDFAAKGILVPSLKLLYGFRHAALCLSICMVNAEHVTEASQPIHAPDEESHDVNIEPQQEQAIGPRDLQQGPTVVQNESDLVERNTPADAQSKPGPSVNI